MWNGEPYVGMMKDGEWHGISHGFEEHSTRFGLMTYIGGQDHGLNMWVREETFLLAVH